MSDALPRKRSPGSARPTGPDKSAVYLGWVAVGALVGLIAGALYFYLQTTRPALRAVVITEYGTAWPVNPFADRDRDRLVPLFAESGEAFADQRLGNLESRLLSFAKLSRRDALIVYCNALATVVGDDVFLIPSGSLGDKSGLLPVSKVVEAIAASPAKHKLLMLDLARPIDDPCHDLRPEVVSDHLDRWLGGLKRAGQLAVPVLTSCGPNQRSYSADAADASAFALAVEAGLRGEADPSHARDHVVESDELAEFVAARVRAYVALVHKAKQEPKYYRPDGAKSFQLNPSPRDPSPIAVAAYPAYLQEAWADVDAAAAGPLPSDDAEFLRLQAALSREDEIWRSREPDPQQAKRVGETRAALKAWVGRKNSDRPTSIVPVLSDAEIRSKTAVDLKAKLAKAAAALAADFTAKPGEEPAEKPDVKAFVDAAKPPPVKDAPPPVPHPLDAARYWVWDRLLNPPPADGKQSPQGQLRAGLYLLEKLDLTDDNSRVMCRNGLLESLAKSDVWTGNARVWPAEAVKLELRAEHAALRLHGRGADARALEQKIDGEAHLKEVGNKENGRYTRDVTEAEARLRSAVDQLERQANDLNQRDEREAVRREVVRALVGRARYLALRPRPAELVDDWESAVKAVTRLDGGSGSPGEARERARALAERLNPTAVLKWAGEIAAAKEPEKLELPAGAVEKAEQLRAWLATPLVPAAERSAAWKALRWCDAKRHEAALTLLAQGRSGGDAEARPVSPLDRLKAGLRKFAGACGGR